MQNRQRAAMSTVVVGGLPVLLVFLFWLKAIEMKLLRWGFIGCGEVTEKKSGPAFNEVAGSEVVAVMSRNAIKARSYAERHGVRNGILMRRNLSTTRM